MIELGQRGGRDHRKEYSGSSQGKEMEQQPRKLDALYPGQNSGTLGEIYSSKAAKNGAGDPSI